MASLLRSRGVLERASNVLRARVVGVRLPPETPRSAIIALSPLRVVFLAHWAGWGDGRSTGVATRGSRFARASPREIERHGLRIPPASLPRASQRRDRADARSLLPSSPRVSFPRANSLGRKVARASSLLTRPSDPRPRPTRLSGWPAAPLQRYRAGVRRRRGDARP